MRYKSKRPNKSLRATHLRGFTLIELLVVIAIIAILAAILFPVFARARDNAKLARCMAHLGQIGKAIMAYTDDNDGYYPIGPSYKYDGGVKTRLDNFWTGSFIGGCQKGVGDSPYPNDRPLYKYTSGNLAMWKCPSETRQNNGPGMPYDFPSRVWGSTYCFNGVYAWEGPWPQYRQHPPLIYILMGRNYAATATATRKTSEVVHPTKLWMVAERTLHYYWNLKHATNNPNPPLGHLGDKPFSPAVFCDGHTDTIYMHGDYIVDPNGRWAYYEKGWNPCPGLRNTGL